MEILLSTVIIALIGVVIYVGKRHNRLVRQNEEMRHVLVCEYGREEFNHPVAH